MDDDDAKELDTKIVFGLVDDSRQIQEEAVRLLLAVHGGILKGTICDRFPGQLSKSELKDVLIRTATKAWKHAASFDDRRSKLSTWLVAIAINETKTLLKENRSQSASESELHLFENLEESTEGAIDSEVLDDLDAFISKLPTLQRSVIRDDLACGGQADAHRLAAKYNTSVNSIYVSRNKAKQKIEAEMIRLGYFSCNELRRNS